MGEVGVGLLREMASMATPMCLRVAATLRLVDNIGEAGATAEELAARTETSISALTKVLDHLVSIGVFDVIDGRYMTTATGQQLHSDSDTGLRDDLDITSWLGRAELSYAQLLHTVTTGTAAYPHHYGQDFWKDLATHPTLRDSFDTKMAHRFREHAPHIAQQFNWSRYHTIVDVGGGTGTLLTEILTAHPSTQGHLIDLPHTATHAHTTFATHGLSQRSTITGGSFFEPLPANADAYILCDILHDWDDNHAHTILTHCAHAAGTHGSILIIEPLQNHGANTEIDLSMLVFFGGTERTTQQLTQLASHHNLTLKNTTPVSPGRTLLEFIPRQPE